MRNGRFLAASRLLGLGRDPRGAQHASLCRGVTLRLAGGGTALKFFAMAWKLFCVWKKRMLIPQPFWQGRKGFPTRRGHLVRPTAGSPPLGSAPDTFRALADGLGAQPPREKLHFWVGWATHSRGLWASAKNRGPSNVFRRVSSKTALNRLVLVPYHPNSVIPECLDAVGTDHKNGS